MDSDYCNFTGAILVKVPQWIFFFDYSRNLEIFFLMETPKMCGFTRLSKTGSAIQK